LLLTMRVAALALASGVASAARLSKKQQIKGWGVPPEDTNTTMAHCGEIRIQGDDHEARGEWPEQNPRVTGAKVPCVNGMAGSYPCSGIDLLSYMPLSDFSQTRGNDIWGWTDPQTGKEYAIYGVREGVVFVDVSDPLNPEYLVYVRSHTSASTWRDIKVYNNRAYLVSEASGHGMQVYDLTRLRGVTSTVEHSPDAHYGEFGNAHNIVINEDTARAYAVGANRCSGGLYIMDITNLQPTYAGCFSADGYTHDAHCVVYKGPDSEHVGKEICAAFNEDTLTMVDVTDASNPIQLSRTGYSGSSYTHQGWFDEDHKYVYGNDELDEGSSDPLTRTLIFNCEDLDNTQFVKFFYHDTNSIDHNGYVHNGYMYQANYCAGARILKVWPDHELSTAAYFDAEPGCSSPTFSGVWSIYPYFASGTIVVSGIGSGLFVLGFSDDYTPPGPTTPAPTPVPTPPPPPGTWELSGSGCDMVGDCVQSKNHPSSYGNNEECSIQLAGSVSITVEAFNTESRYDFLTMGGQSYSGSSGPSSGSYTGSITWSSDYSVVQSGWKLCKN